MHFGLSRARSRIEIQIQVCKLNLESLMGLCDWKKGILRPKTDKPSLGQIYGICGSTACERGLPGGSEGEGMPLLQSCENRLLWSDTASPWQDWVALCKVQTKVWFFTADTMFVKTFTQAHIQQTRKFTQKNASILACLVLKEANSGINTPEFS